jgi:hypothetical protein
MYTSAVAAQCFDKENITLRLGTFEFEMVVVVSRTCWTGIILCHIRFSSSLIVLHSVLLPPSFFGRRKRSVGTSIILYGVFILVSHDLIDPVPTRRSGPLKASLT